MYPWKPSKHQPCASHMHILSISKFSFSLVLSWLWSSCRPRIACSLLLLWPLALLNGMVVRSLVPLLEQVFPPSVYLEQFHHVPSASPLPPLPAWGAFGRRRLSSTLTINRLLPLPFEECPTIRFLICPMAAEQAAYCLCAICLVVPHCQATALDALHCPSLLQPITRLLVSSGNRSLISSAASAVMPTPMMVKSSPCSSNR